MILCKITLYLFNIGNGIKRVRSESIVIIVYESLAIFRSISLKFLLIALWSKAVPLTD